MTRSTEQFEHGAEAIFLEALELPEDQRAAFVDSSCMSNPQLHARVTRLLRHAAAASPDFMSATEQRFTGLDEYHQFNVANGPHFIDQYEIKRLIGVGGMGAVYEAIESTTSRKVAIKLLRSAFASPTELARFRREAEILEKLDHPAIAKLYSTGSADTIFGPHAYIAIEYVEGRHLLDWNRQPNRTNRQRLELMATICDAVQVAHDQNIIHRDLKPANILVDDKDKPHILDFGISLVAPNDQTTQLRHTATGQMIGTLAYMSPEQAAGETKQIDARSDLFALGVILYELLTSRLPFDVDGRSLESAARIIREEDPRHLSHFDLSYRGALEAVTSKALEKSPASRYASAGEMAEDLRRYLRSQPVVARTPSLTRQIARYARRHRKLVVTATCILATLLAITVFSTRIAIRESRLRARAERSNYRANLRAAQLALESDNFVAARRLVDALAQTGAGTWEYRHLRRCLDASAITIAAHNAAITSVDVSDDGRTALSASVDGSIQLWNIAARTSQIIRNTGSPVRDVKLFANGARFASLADDGSIRIWNSSSHVEERTFSSATWKPVRFDISPDEARLVATCSDRRIRIWDLGSGQLVLTSAPHEIPISVVHFLDDQRILVGENRGMSCWSAVTGEHLFFADGGIAFHPSSIDVSKNMKQIVTGCRDSSIALWDTRTLKPARKLDGHLGGVSSVAINDGGDLVLSAGRDETIRLWEAASGSEIRKFLGHTARVSTVAFVPDSKLIVSGAADGTLRFWNKDDQMSSPCCRVLTDHTSYVYDVEFNSNGTQLASAAWDGTVRLWNPHTGVCDRVLQTDDHRVECIAYSPDGKTLAAGTSSQFVRVWRLDTYEVMREFELPANSIKSLAFDANGEYLLAVQGVPHTTPPMWNAGLWHLPSGTTVSQFRATVPMIASSSPQGLRLLKAIPGAIEMIDPVTSQVLYAFAGHETPINNFSFSPDGRRFLTAANDGTAAVWDTSTGTRIAALRGHTDKVYDAIFSPDGTRIATGSNDNTIRLWNAANFDELLVLQGHENYVHGLAFSPDGRALVSGSGDHTIRIWTTKAK